MIQLNHNHTHAGLVTPYFPTMGKVCFVESSFRTMGHDPGLKEKFGIGHHAYGEILLFVGFVSMNGHQDDYLNMTM